MCYWFDVQAGRNRFRFFHFWSEWRFVEVLSMGELWKRRMCKYCLRTEAEFIYREDKNFYKH